MKNLIISTLLISFLALVPAFAGEGGSLITALIWKSKEPYFLQIQPLSSKKLALLSPNSLYVANKNLNLKKRIFRVPKFQKMKKIIFTHESLFLLTDKSLYLSKDDGMRWKIIFNSTSLGDEFVTFEIYEDTLLLGATSGLYSSTLKKLNFKKINNFPANTFPLSIKMASENVYFVLTDRSLWKTRDGGMSFEKTFSTTAKETESDLIAPEILEQKTPNTFGDLQALAINPIGDHVWIGTKRGIFQSSTGGLHFKKLSPVGLSSENISHIIWTSRNIVASTSDGIYILEKERWKRLCENLNFGTVYDLLYSNKHLWISSFKRGIDRIKLPDISGTPILKNISFSPNVTTILKQIIKNEPSVRKTQEAAIRYSNTPNAKTKLWQISSRLRALLPTLSYSVGKSRGNNIDLDRGSTNTPDIYITGPEDWGRDMDIDVSWDLGDLFFSSAQTSIDSREKLMVELRDELVSEITRLYYERRRLQIDLIFKELKKETLINTWIRIEEITAQIDGMTGGWFSKHIKHKETIVDRLEKL